MDITPLFKACVKTVRLTNKKLPQPDKNRILKKKHRSEIHIKSKDICYQITQVRDFLIENRAAYMKYASHLKKSAHMTDDERNLIDMECEKIFSVCFQLINDLKSKKKEVKVLKQESEHFDGILELLTNYIKIVQTIFHQQKKFRAQQDVETYKLLKLESDKKLSVIVPSPKVVPESVTDENKSSSVKRSNLNVHLDEEQVINKLESEEKSELSPEDIQMFESENVQLFNELKGLSEELEQIERNVVDIANLQSVFTEKVTYFNIVKDCFLELNKHFLPGDLTKERH